MDWLSKLFPNVRTSISLAAFALLIVFLLKDTLVEVLHVGGSEALSLVLGFLLIFLVLSVGMGFLYGISKKEIEEDNKTRGNAPIIKGSKKVKMKARGTGNDAKIMDSEDIDLDLDSTTEENKKKA